MSTEETIEDLREMMAEGCEYNARPDVKARTLKYARERLGDYYATLARSPATLEAWARGESRVMGMIAYHLAEIREDLFSLSDREFCEEAHRAAEAARAHLGK